MHVNDRLLFGYGAVADQPSTAGAHEALDRRQRALRRPPEVGDEGGQRAGERQVVAPARHLCERGAEEPEAADLAA